MTRNHHKHRGDTFMLPNFRRIRSLIEMSRSYRRRARRALPADAVRLRDEARRLRNDADRLAVDAKRAAMAEARHAMLATASGADEGMR